MDFLPSDLIFTRSPRTLGKLIRWFEKGHGEAPSWTNHTAGIGLQGNTVIEALWTVQETPWPQWESQNGCFQVWRNTRLSDVDRRIVAAEATAYVGRQYGWWKLGPHLFDGMLSKVMGGNVYAMRRCLFLENYPICSWVWAYAYAKIGIRFGCDPDCADPDTMLDFISLSAEWDLVDEKGV